ncbi:hypothetical protein HY486_00230 [Candidatus Woesearchaeota archaeon]|nr:hypothetical protein [Candidatus Woesearchaeota archaeon]
MSRVQRMLKHWLLFLIILFFVFAKLYVLSLYHLPGWDESVYVGMGKYIFSFGSSGVWEQIRPPLLPVVLGFFWKLGLDPVFWGELFIILCSVGLIVATYFIALKFSFPVAVISSFFVAFSPVFFLYSNYLYTHIPSVLLVTIGLLVSSSIAKGVLSTFAALFRFPMGISLFLHRWKKELFIAAFLVAVPFFFVNYVMYNDYTSESWHAVFRPLILGSSHQQNSNEFVKEGVFYYAVVFAKEFPLLLVFLPVGAFFVWKHPVFRFFLVLALYYHIIPNRQDRFAIEFLPFMAVISGVGLWWYVKKVRFNRIVLVFLLLLFVPVLLMDYSRMNWRSDAAPPVVSEYYSFLSGIDGNILTSDPVVAVYSDAHFVPYYFYLDTVPAIVNEWEKGAKISAVVWSESAFPCSDSDCVAVRSILYKNISSARKVFSGAYAGKTGNRTYEVFSYGE